MEVQLVWDFHLYSRISRNIKSVSRETMQMEFKNNYIDIFNFKTQQSI